MPGDLEIRLLRYFVAVAEELNFTRAAERLYVAQQALSREIRKLEDRAGVRLLDRTTRRVRLTSAGEALLPRARELVALHDLTVRNLQGERTALTVDVVGPGLTPSLVLAEARRRAPGLEFFARHVNGADSAAPLLLAERVDVTFGRAPDGSGELVSRPVRHEPIAVLVPEGHELAGLDGVPLESLRGAEVCIRAGDHATPGWEHAMLQLLASFGPGVNGTHPHVQGGAELAQHLANRDAPVLCLASQPDVPGGVVRPLVEPVAAYPWSMVWRRTDDGHPGIAALLEAAATLGAEHDWLGYPQGAWLPQPERG